jgi:MFS transporter, DHA2 family, multidrug resistance protein
LKPERTEDLFARFGRRYQWLATITVMMGTLSAMITTTIVNVALPDIMGAFGVGQDRAQWLSTGALAAMTIGMLVNAWLIHSFGQRKTFIVALSIFVGALAVAGLSPNDSVLIMARIVQGGIAGILQPLAMFTIFRVFPPDQRGMAMGFFGMSVLLGPALGPTLGGIIIEHFNWRYIFYVAMPICIASIMMGSVFLPEREETGPRMRFDWTGFVLMVLALSCLLTGLSNGQREGWQSAYVLTLVGIALTACAAFFWWELHTNQPLVNLRVFKNVSFAAASAVACIFGIGLFGSTYLVPLYVQTLQHFTPLSSGLLLMPAGIIMGICMPIAGFLSDRIAARNLVIAGLVCFGISSFWLARVDSNMTFWSMAWAVVFSRVGLAIMKPSLNVAALRALPPEHLGQGAGMINFARQLGGAFGVNLLSVTLDRRTFFHSDTLTATQTSSNSTTAELLRSIRGLLAQGGVPEDLQAAGALNYLAKVIYAQAYTMGFRDSFLVVGIVFTFALLPAWIMGRNKPARLRV